MTGNAPASPARPERRPGGVFALVGLALTVLLWQYGFTNAAHESRRPWAMAASMGMSADAPWFFYFLHHFGVFPVAAREVPRLGPTKADAEAFVAKHGERLTTDTGLPTSTARFGDYGKLYLFYPDLWLRGDPGHASAIPFDRALFALALLATLVAFWAEERLLLGALLVLFVGSDPFQVLEVHARGNVFSLPISLALLALAAHLRYLTGRASAGLGAWCTALISGVVLACFREVRTEAVLMAPALLVTYTLMRGPLARRLLLVLTFLAAFMLTGMAWASHWRALAARAETFVTRAGGQVVHAPHGQHHAFWHAIACGLGDYGGDRGYSWDDRAAFQWATSPDPHTNPHPLPYHWTHGYFFDETSDGVHPIAPTDLPAYNALLRARVLGDIGAHPLWYVGILGQRALAILRDATPLALSAGAWTFALPGAGWALLPILAYALWRRDRFALALIAFTLPLSLVALLVYSGRGATFYSIAHLVAIAVAIDAAVRAVRGSHGSAVHVR